MQRKGFGKTSKQTKNSAKVKKALIWLVGDYRNAKEEYGVRRRKERQEREYFQEKGELNMEDTVAKLCFY